MSFFDIITRLFEKFASENRVICDHLANELFNIEADIYKLNNLKKKNRDIKEDIEIIFVKHLLKSSHYNPYKSKFQDLKSDICGIYKSKNMNNIKYYDELIKINNYNIGD
jgi:predicted metallo-beta-lactamase superfamily hydrolase